MDYYKLILAVLIASIFLNLFIFLRLISEKFFKVKLNLPDQLAATGEVNFSKVVNLIAKAEIVEVILPVFFYSLTAPFLPFSGVKSGIFFAILIFSLGALPQFVWFEESFKLPTNYLMHTLLWQLLKAIFIFGTFGLILSS